jgi:class 3 adenylate cyclase
MKSHGSFHAVLFLVAHQLLYSVWNWDVNSVPFYNDMLKTAVRLRTEGLWTNVRKYTTAGVSFTPEQHAAMHSNRGGSQPDQPHSFRFIPVFRSLQDSTSDPVAIITFPVAWDVPLRNSLPETVEEINVVLRNTCNQSFTYLVTGSDAFYIGEGDLHDHNFDGDGLEFELWESTDPDFLTDPYHCRFSVTVYPTQEFKDSHMSDTPKTFAIVIAGTFLLMIAAFVIYDLIVQRRNQKLVYNAARSNAIVTSLFPKNVRDRIVAQEPNEGDIGDNTRMKGPPIADLYLESTIMFADVVGFTAWSSVREPSQVFCLLESIYGAFDNIAAKRRIFKVETVGDCYVAAAGIPEYRKDHAIAIVQFAGDIMIKMSKLVKELEITLGPDTGDLSLRIGVHSGPITAGVLRGQRSRFQLFGDTMNTTARIESTGQSGGIHMSSETAELLIRDGKGHWIEKRHDMIAAKGKGSLQTYWLKFIRGRYCYNDCHTSEDTTTLDSSDSMSDTLIPEEDNDKTSRLIDWNTETLVNLLKQIVATRSAARIVSPRDEQKMAMIEKTSSRHPLDEVQEIILLPEYDADAVSQQKTPESVDLGHDVVNQVRQYVTLISAMYRKNAFHNFEHASHVAMSVTKLLSRIVAPRHIAGDNVNHELHDHTYGITSDPLTQFSCAFSALIHDVEHTGVPNAQLVLEQHPLTALFKNRSVAEQYSLTLSWDLLLEDRFKAFRSCLYTTEAELLRFRHLVVNGVMATDIADEALKNLRNARWAKAFDEHKTMTPMASPSILEQTKADVDRKATIVIEHLIQASDIAHTMQHWHVYRKWNERLFTEMYQAFLDGRADKDPSTFWYQGEIGFFDFYIIPLAKKLKECGVFGISSDEYLNYALNNRKEWEHRGQEMVADMLDRIPSTLVVEA